MSDAVLVQPDLTFSEQIANSGGTDLRKCYQCATCSVVCELSQGDSPFPRKEMIWAQWGLKDRLLADPDVWVCHNCNDCSVHCPRGAKPGDVLAAIRKQAVSHYSIPSFLYQWANRPVYLPLMMLIPAVLLVLALLVRDPLGSALGFTHHHGEGMEYANLFPHWLLIGFFTFFWGLAVFLGMLGVSRYWKAMKKADLEAGREGPQKGLIQSALKVFTDLLLHNRFSKCKSLLSRRQAHFYAFYGFWILFFVSAWAVVILYILNPIIEDPFLYPFPFLNPAKIIANIGALALVVGCILAIVQRLRSADTAGKSTEFDWMFLGILLTVGVTGILVEALRFAQNQPVGYAVYFVHLIFAFMLLVYLPYSKFAHLFYRTAALIYAESSGRNELSAPAEPIAAPAAKDEEAA